MRLNKLFLLYSLIGMLMSSCIQDEAPNAEADIETCTVVSPENIINDVLIENRKITLFVKPNSNVKQVKVDFTLTPGATIEPTSGTIRDFTTPKIYTVTSEDRKWKKEYIIEVVESSASIPTEYHFEHAELIEDKYQVFYEVLPNGTKQYIWASGNAGFAIVAYGKDVEDYPTTLYTNGKSGKCAKLETRSTGGLGGNFGMPIAAGNLFIGKFNVANATTRPLQATQFGAAFNFVPTALTGYYQYKAGPVFTDKKNNVVPDMKDNFDIYAIIYETDNAEPLLNGTNQLTSPRLISVARIKDADKKETNEWTAFNIPFELKPGKTLDKAKLQEGKYNISIVFSASIYGDQFRGAVGSTLLIDEVKCVTEE